ncbi:MAG: IclR family transcriptional regulator [Alphaproteobacteria bacterium]|nr:IclR family transcriptional regulator [Alphaproteobacteria bacterium]
MHLDRLISVLETVAIAGRPVSASELQKATGLPRPTCYRLLQTLAEHRLLDDPDGNARYLIGDRLIRIALMGKSDVDIRHAAAPAMKQAATEFGESVFLSRFRNNGVEIIHVETPADPARAHIHPGLGFRPMHACSCSKAIAAFAEEGFRDDILKGPLKPYTEHTKTTPNHLRQEFLDIRQRGYAECVEEIELGVSSVAAPITLGNVGATFSVGATGPVRRFTDAYRTKVGSDLMRVAAKVTAAIQLYDTA